MGQVSRPPRVYQPIWSRLRKQGRCELAVVDQKFVPRIKKAISKEKNLDDGFKLLNAVENFYLTFEYLKEKKILVVELKSRFGLTEMQG